MDLAFSAEQAELASVVHKFLTGSCGTAEVLAQVEGAPGWDRTVWQRLADEIGVHGLAVPEEFGGSGFGVTELGAVFEELGRFVTPGPYLATLGLAAPALVACGDDRARAEFLPGIAAGTTVAALALHDDGGPPVTAAHADGSWVLDGTRDFVLAGADADLLLVPAETGSGTRLFAVGADAPGLTRTGLATLDPTRGQARLDLAAVPGRPLGDPDGARAALAEARRTGRVLLAAEQVGAMAATVDLSVAYSHVRHQFGRPIGSFQAVQHKAADMLLHLEAGRSAELYALWAVDADAPDAEQASRIATITCSQGLSFCAGQCMQIHGGIGFTWEHAAHLYLKRGKSSEVLLGSPAAHCEALAADLLGT